MSRTNLLKTLTVIFLGTALASAQAFRTWVSGVGNDADPCSRTAPCKTFAGAISRTIAGGEIDVLDPGGFGQLTITKAITIDGGGGQVASVLATGGDGIVVQAGSNDVVILRNLRLNGVNQNAQGGGGTNGIRFLGGKALHIENCTIFGFTNNGIDIAKSDGGSAYITNTFSTGNGASGVSSVNTVNKVSVFINGSHFENNLYGVKAGDFSNVNVRDSAASSTGMPGTVGFYAVSNGGTNDLNITNSAATEENSGIFAGSGTAPSNVRITGVTLYNNVLGIFISSNGTVQSFGNNYNAGPGMPNGTAIVPQ